jgi:hypothetical protein
LNYTYDGTNYNYNCIGSDTRWEHLSYFQKKI